MAPLATAFVRILPDMSVFAVATATGVQAAGPAMARAGATQGALYGSAFSRSAGRLIAAGSAVGFALLVKEAVQAAGNFEAAMVRLTTSAGETGTLVSGNLKIVAAGIKDLALQVGYGTTDLAKAMYVVESAGYRAADGLNVLKFAAEAAKAENSDLTTVVDALTTVMIDYHQPAANAADIMNTLLAAAATSKVNLNDLAKSLHSVTPAASMAGIALEDILGALSAMTQHGFSAQQATQNLADVIRHMQAPTNIQAKELALLGLTTNQLAQSLRDNGLTGTLQMISERIKNMMPPGSQNVILSLQTALQKLSGPVRELGEQLIKGSISFADYRKAARELTPIQNAQAMSFYSLASSTHRIGDEQLSGAKVLQTYTAALAKATGDATGLNVALVLTGENAAGVNEMVKTIGAAALEAGGHVKGWAAIQETFNFKLAQTKAAFGVVGIALGETLLPVLGKVMEGFTAILGPLAHWISEYKTLSAVIFSSIGVFITLGTAIIIVSRLAMGLRALAAALRLAAIAQFLFLSPWGLIIVAIAAVVGALVYAYFHFDKFREIVDTVFRAIVAALGVFWEYAQIVFHALVEIIMNDVVPAFIWLWQRVLVPAFHGMIIAMQAWWVYAQFVFNLVRTVIMEAFVPAVLWMKDNVWEPVFKVLVIAMKAWWEYAKVVFGLVSAVIRDVFAPAVLWMWHHVWEPGLKGLAVALAVWWEYAKVVFNFISSVIRNVVGPVILWLWHNVFEPAFSALAVVLRVWVEYAKVVFDIVTNIIHGVGDTVMWLWDHAFKPTFEAIGAVINWLYKNIVEPAFGAIGHIIQAWWVVVQVVFAAAQFWIEKILSPIIMAFWHQYMEPAWEGIKLAVSLAWAIIKGIWKDFSDGAGNLGFIIKALWQIYVAPAWNGIKDVIVSGWGTIKPIFDKLVDIVKVVVPSAFRDALDIIGKIWNSLKATVAVPVNFVIRFVVNDGIIKMWNTVAGFFGVKDRIDPVPPIPGFAQGGKVHGFGGGRQDAVPIMASAGEYVIPANVVSDIGVGFFDGLIGKRKPVEKPGDGSSGIAIGHYADGGLVDFIMNPVEFVSGKAQGYINKIPGVGLFKDLSVAAGKKLLAGLVDWAKRQMSSLLGGDSAIINLDNGLQGVMAWLWAQNGKPYGWAQAGPSSYDCSGIVSSVWNLLHGANPYRHTFSTSGQGLFFPKRNQVGILTAGWANPGERGGGSVGHTAANFAGVGLESTGSRGVRIGVGTTPVTNFAHWGTFADGGMVGTPLIRSYDRGGSWPSGTLGINTSGRTEQVSTGGDMSELIDLIREQNMLQRRQILALERVGQDVGAELTGVSSRMRQMSRLR